MNRIELIFPAELDETDVLRILSAADSGFEPEDRHTFNSALVDGFSIAGVIFSAGSLGVAIWALKAQLADIARKRGSKLATIRYRTEKSEEVFVLPDGGVKTMVRTFEEFSETTED